MADYLYAFTIYPIEMFIETIFSISMEMVPGVGYAILFVSIAVQMLVLPIYKHADDLQDEERARQKEMSPVVDHIRKTFRGDEKVMILSTFYRVKGYHQYYQLRAVLPLLLQIPFFIAAYHFLSNCKALDGASFYFLRDMGKPDAMLSVGGIAINVMPILMTVINILSGVIYTKGLGLKDKLQLYITAGVFLVLLYNSPSGLVFYWTLNNVFSLLKNVFMKLVKNPRPVVSIGAFLFVCAYLYKCLARGDWESEGGRIVMIAVFVIGLIPLVTMLRATGGKASTGDDRLVFRISTVVLTITLGFLIPAVTIASSPTEFVVRGHFVDPLVPVLYCLTVAAGTFSLWGNIIYSFYSESAKRILAPGLFIVAVSSLVNSQVFRQGLKNMSMNMIYYDGFDFPVRERLINLGVLIAVAIICILLYFFSRKSVVIFASALVGVVAVLSARSVYAIERTLNNAANIRNDDYYINNKACYSLDKSGRNVVVLFEDRAFGQFLPYIINEKPELANVYSGFTYYKNTISFGTRTYTGSPALYGGYEYTEWNLRDKDSEYRNNCVKVMPKLFADAGYKTTVFDIPFYVDLEGRSIEDYYHDVSPDINAFYVDGVVTTRETAQSDYAYFEKAARSNFIRHSIFLSSPLILRTWYYDSGRYLMQTAAEDRITYTGHMEELNKLPEMAVVSDTGANTFTFIENDAPHSMDINLQMPDYTLEDEVDNSEYITEWKEKLESTPGERKINMNTLPQIQAYEVNMATILSIGRWIEYLKANNLYDNTRIIIVADHGYSYFTFDDMLMDTGDGQKVDLDLFVPLLMVKDFADSDGYDGSGIVTSDEFMTNADVPSLAMKGLIEDPVDPYSGQAINSDQKYEREQFIFDDRIWLSVYDDIYEIANWSVCPDQSGE